MTRSAACSSLALALLLSIEGCHSPGEPEGGLRTHWLRPQASGLETIRPTADSDAVYVATHDGDVVARAHADGAERWRARIATGAPGGENMLVAAGTLVVPVGAYTVGLEARTGQERWRYRAPPDTVAAGPTPGPGSVRATRIASDGAHVYLPAWGASVSAVDLGTGVARWTWRPGPAPSDTAASGVFRSGAEGVVLSGDTVYVAAWHFLDWQGLRSEPWLIALDRRDGRELWRHVFPSFSGGVLVWSGPVVHERLVILKGTGGELWALDRFTGASVWTFVPQTLHASLTGPIARDGVVYVDSGDDYITAVDARDGRVRWRAMTANRGAYANLLATARYLYVPGGGNGLGVIERRTGRVVVNARQPQADAYAHVATAAAEIGGGRIVVNVRGGAWAFAEP